MVKRHYCDYCDKSYPYSVEARKKHLSGHYHHKFKKLHYDQFKSAREKLQDEAAKVKCRKFQKGLECAFGDTCIYSHLTDMDVQCLQQQAREEQAALKRSKLPSQLKSGDWEPSLAEWLSKRQGKLELTSDCHVEDLVDWEDKYKLPQSITDVTFLPPSLIPPSADNLLQSSFEEWG